MGAREPAVMLRVMPRLALAAFAALMVPALAACPTKKIPRPYPDPGAEAVIAHVNGLRERAGTLRAETLSDARIGKERANVTVLILAAWGGKLRYMAMNPGEVNMAADLASDGTEYCFVDANNNCGECGPATPENVGRLIQVVMAPDDVVTMMLGGTPLLTDATAKLEWKAEGGQEILTLERSDGWRQRVVLDGREKRWDVLDAELEDPEGTKVWRIRHKDFHPVKNGRGETVRLPGKSFFEQPGNSVLIQWKEQELDVPLGDEKFRMEFPTGLGPCGG
jgi:hypothetical protein